MYADGYDKNVAVKVWIACRKSSGARNLLSIVLAHERGRKC